MKVRKSLWTALFTCSLLSMLTFAHTNAKMEREREAKKRAKDEELARKNISVQQVIGENPNQVS